ncbi:hypothetical protein QBC38DRAFT_204443 [Podospora fimiseda]|uniref:Uncharacterized protein n=1 Tax=Podospora fimiseda TaxID=252190 RepID=A0AAN7BY82_9PEZI|nr:hypothetical protein QBC38DRAFT_204443 [Podospora fimiseda]
MVSEAGHDEIWISKACHVQTAEQRFGSHVREAINAYLTEPPSSSEFDDADDDDDDDDDDFSDSDVDFWDPTTDAFDLDGDLAAGNLGYLTVEANFGFLLGTTLTDWVTMASQPSPPAAREDAGFPRIARYRCNLTALSQRFDLYFAAYQDKIYVYRPQRAPRILPPPCLVLHPGRTRAAKFTPGHVDPRFAHQINNVVVGDLGNLEIVAFAYDDGDVAAYYIHTIARHISESTMSGLRRPALAPKLMFHDNVGLSAWGLAIHPQSRLIAVGSNKHEVTVFAFALSRAPPTAVVPESDGSPMVWSGQTALELQRHLQSRSRTWKIILPLGTNGGNIPSVSFVNDDRGEAEKVAAQDIFGNTWMLDIWKIGVQPTFCQHMSERSSARYKGWGVLMLPSSSFKLTKSIPEALGLPSREILQMQRTTLDITCGLFYIKGLAVDVANVLRNHSFGHDYVATHNQGSDKPSPPVGSYGEDSDSNLGPEDDDEEWEDDMEMGAGTTDPVKIETSSTHQDSTGENSRWAAITKTRAPDQAAITDISEDWHVRRTILPLFGETPPPDELDAPAFVYGKEKKKRVKPVAFQDAVLEMPKSVVKDLCIFRSNLTDFELIPLDNSSASVCYKHVVTFHDHFNRTSAPFGFNKSSSERVNMLLHVPELHLVVAGSPCGRVALITLTKAQKWVHKDIRFRRGFRIDRVLPRKEEEEKRIRPWCELIGIAMSPVPGARARGLDLHPQGPIVTYRLVLHYLDHTILTYEIERSRKDQEELIVY